MTITPDDVLAVMPLGRDGGVTVAQLAVEVAEYQRRKARLAGEQLPTLRTGSAAQRKIRAAVEVLRREGHAICATPEDGYYLAESDEELSSTIGFLRSRAMTSLVQIAQLRRMALPELMGQLQIELVAQEAAERAAKPCGRTLSPAAQIEAKVCPRCYLGPCTEPTR